MEVANYQCGFVALIGKPNTGKSTLMNALVGEKLSITAHRPQTTRHQIMGIKTTDEYQCIFVDTPGIHQNQKKAINRYMNRAATSMLDDVDLICVLLDVRSFNQDDEQILQRIKQQSNVILFKASHKSFLDFGSKAVSTATESMTEEMPYALTVNVEHYKTESDLVRISASIWVERKSQKGIVIGQRGSMLKKIGSEARRDIEKLVDCKVYIQLWVKVREDWSDDEQSLAAFGYFSD